jgi:UDP-N-acetylglucosamine transferase subunit ALG13
LPVIFVVISMGYFDALIAECARLHSKYDFVGQIGSGTVVPPFRHFRTTEPDNLEALMRDSELVISHAGTGMLSMLYRMRKPCVVIPKQIRYGEANDGQVELAMKWGELGMGVLCLDVKELESAIERARKFEFQYPRFPSLGEHLYRRLGLADRRQPAISASGTAP